MPRQAPLLFAADPSRRRSNSVSYADNEEIAVSDIRDVVAARRGLGDTTHRALHIIATAYNVAQRRVFTLFYRDQPFLIEDAERRSLALAAAAMLDRSAAEHLERADQCEAKADAIRTRERQLTLPFGEGKCRDKRAGVFAPGCIA